MKQYLIKKHEIRKNKDKSGRNRIRKDTSDMKKRVILAVVGLMFVLLAVGCGEKRDEDSKSYSLLEGELISPDDTEDLTGDLSNEDATEGENGERADNSKSEGGDSGSKTSAKSGALIESQTFQVNLNPLGKVTFASYEADIDKNPLADAIFQIEKDGNVLQKLEGPFADDCRTNEVFNQVEAVSFLDCNRDGYDDIIIICSYMPSSGPEVGTGYSEVRYYTGSKEGSFVYEEQTSLDITSALAEITIESVKGFLGVDRKAPIEPWQQAYITYLEQESDVEGQRGYELISIDGDEIPELVEIGVDAATGCRIVNYTGGKVNVTQLNRLYFSYIEEEGLLCNSEGNMDYYYDLVYRLENGEMKLIAEGYYGAEDNSRVQFDESGEPIYKYEWNGKEMSKADYEAELNKVYDTSKAKRGYEWDAWHSVDEMINIVWNYMSGF